MTSLIFISCLVSLFIIFYVYIGYPFILFLLTFLTKSRFNKQDEQLFPSVSLLISCYNEEAILKEKITNSLSIDYPKDKLKIIVISDGSDDSTDEIAKSFATDGIELIRQDGRLGKTSAINLAMKEVSSEIVVFSDANAMYQTDAIKKLVRNFADDNIGYVVGAAIYTDGKENSAAASENIYWQYEIKLKKMESDLHSVVGGDGAIYSIRRELYIELDSKDINDFVNPLQIIKQGFRGVFEPCAICLEETAGDFSKEAKRKQRIVNRSFRGLMKVKTVLNPFKYGFFSFEVISHKLLRWLIPVFIINFTLGSLYLAYQELIFFQLISFLGILFLWLAQIGMFKSKQKHISPIFFLPYYFLMVNYYSLIGVVTALAGNIQVTWSTPRSNDKVKETASAKFIALTLTINIALFIMFIQLLKVLF